MIQEYFSTLEVLQFTMESFCPFLPYLQNIGESILNPPQLYLCLWQIFFLHGIPGGMAVESVVKPISVPMGLLKKNNSLMNHSIVYNETS